MIGLLTRYVPGGKNKIAGNIVLEPQFAPHRFPLEIALLIAALESRTVSYMLRVIDGFYLTSVVGYTITLGTIVLHISPDLVIVTLARYR